MARQTDIEESPVDPAIAAVRGFQKGTVNLAQLRALLKPLDASQLVLVSIGCRIPGDKLRLLRDS